MSWEIVIPYRSRSDSLAAVGDAIREAIDDPEDRAVARRIVLDAATRGDVTAGDVLDRVEAASPDERRAMLDSAREAEGLKRSAAIDAEPIRHVAGNEGMRLQVCAAENCVSYPGYPGPWEMSAARRWFCEAHRDQAQPGDLDPTPERYAIVGPFNVLTAVGPERERLEAEERKRQEAAEERDRRAEAELEAIKRARERFADSDEAITTVMDLRVRPDGRIVES